MNSEIENEFERLYAAARDESFRGRADYVVELLERMIKLADGHEELMKSAMYEHAQRNLALAYYDQNQHWKAVEHFRRAVELGTEVDSLFYRQYGRSLFLAGEYESAIQTLRKALDLDEEDDEARYFLGLAYAAAAKIMSDLGARLQYRKLAQEQCNRIKDVSAQFAGVLQGQIAGIPTR
jgi:tetratricopeptide (TPR) repeat protein